MHTATLPLNSGDVSFRTAAPAPRPHAVQVQRQFDSRTLFGGAQEVRIEASLPAFAGSVINHGSQPRAARIGSHASTPFLFRNLLETCAAVILCIKKSVPAA